MRPPPQQSTLFPYTTLFRSRLDELVLVAGDGQRAAVAPLTGHVVGEDHGDVGAARRLHRLGDHRDRKSTRLNSSHTVISYAVFCLKKKIISNRQICMLTYIH